MAQHRCQYCGKPFASQRALNHHISASKSCYKEWRKDLIRKEQPSPSPKRPNRNSSVGYEEELDGVDLETNIVDDFILPSAPRRESIEEEDNGGCNTHPIPEINRYIEPYPGDAGQGLRKANTQFEELLAFQKAEGKKPWEPFASEEEWALSKWLLKNVGQKSTEEFLKLPIVSHNYIPVNYSGTHQVSQG